MAPRFGKMEHDNGNGGRGGGARTVRHKPHQQPNAVSDYIQQSLDALVVSNPENISPPPRRRPRKRKPKKEGMEPITMNTTPCWMVIVDNMVQTDELEDEDECGDIVADLTADFERFGPLQSLDLDRETAVLTVAYTQEANATAAIEATHGRVFSGRLAVARLQAEVFKEEPVKPPIELSRPDRDSDRKKTKKRRTKIKNAVIKAQEGQVSQDNVVVVKYHSRAFEVQNMVDAAEVEDDDEYEEVLNDTNEMLSQHGAIKALSISRCEGGSQPGEIAVEYETAADAQEAFGSLDGKVFGGRQVKCAWRAIQPAATVLRVDGMLEVDELEDDNEFADIQDEVEAFFSQDRGVSLVGVSQSTGQVAITFEKVADADAAMQRLAQTTYGGRKLTVEMDNERPSSEQQAATEIAAPVSRVDLQSVVEVSDEMKGLLAAFLERLTSLQERAHIQNPLQDKRSRRLVLGLHEVKRGLSSRRIKLLLLASNLDECDVLDGKLAEIVALAAREDVPILRGMTRRKLGRILKKHARVSCVGVYSFDGANDLYQQVLHEHQQLQRLAKTAPK